MKQSRKREDGVLSIRLQTFMMEIMMVVMVGGMSSIIFYLFTISL